MLPIATLSGYGDMQGVSFDSTGLIGSTFLYGSGLLGFNIVQLALWIPWRDPFFAPEPKRRFFLFGQILLFVSLVWVVIYPLSQGVDLSLGVEYSARNIDLIMTQLWVVTIFFVNGGFIYFLWKYSSLRASAKVALWVFLITYSGLMLLALSVRRDILPLLLFGLAVSASRKKMRLNASYVFILVGTFILFLIFGVVREIPKDAPIDLQVQMVMLISNNEFSIPIQKTIPYIENEGWMPKFGWTYVYWPLMFIPRAIFENKPVSLAWSVENDTGVNIAAAYTPVTEAFVNFKWMGPFVVMVLLSFFMSYLIRYIERFSLLYFLCFAFIVDFNRGEFALTVYSLIIVWLGYLFTAFCCGIFLHRKSRQNKVIL
jgi:hypothetical protein